MTCEQIERDDIAGQYVLGRLSDEARAEFEDHYFDCSQCRDQVEQLEAVRHALADAGPAMTAERAVLDGHATRPWRRWGPAAGALAAAAVLILAVQVNRDIPAPPPSDTTSSSARDVELPPPAPGPDIAALAAIQPPSFIAPRLRSSTDAARRTFLSAMELYGQGDYAGATGGLEEAVRGNPAFPGARFFLAVCYLQLNRTAEAIDQLREVTRQGESPYLEDAHFFLGKAFIRTGDVEAARREWNTVVKLDGDRRAEALRLLAEMR